MKVTLFSLHLQVFLFTIATLYAQVSHAYTPPNTNRVLTAINSSWKFHRGNMTGAQNPGYDDSTWQDIDLPHTWNNLDGQDGDDDYWTGIGWYRKHYILPESFSDREIYLQFDGANLVTEVYVNGNHVGKHKGGYARFRFPVTGAVHFGSDNVIAVRVQNWGRNESPLPPTSADFTFFGGIYRDVHILTTDRLHIRVLDFSGPGVHLRQSNVSSLSADLEITTKIINGYELDKNVTLRTIIVDKKGNVAGRVSATQSIESESRYDFVQNITIDDPHLWNGTHNPYMYKVFAEVFVDNHAMDVVAQPLGLRYFGLDPDEGFFLNGQYTDLHGVSRHQDRIDMGWAITNHERDQDFAFIMEMGANAIRVAHYQQSQYWYDRCDEKGVIVWAEIPFVNQVQINPEFYDSAKQQLQELIRQNFNHPSILFWGIGNETNRSPDPWDLLDQLNELAIQEDPDRITIYASNHAYRDSRNFMTDAIGFNKYFGWYDHTYNDIGDWLDGFHMRYPDRFMSLSEYGAGASIYHHEESPATPKWNSYWHPEEYQSEFHEAYWQALDARHYVFGKWIWNMFDFASDRRNEGDTDGRNDKGMVTYDRRTRKDAFFFYKANWNPDDRFVHITSRRARNRSNTDVEVKVYSNCDTVELKVNGVSKGLGVKENGVFRWTGLDVGDGDAVEAFGTGGYTDSIIWNKGESSITITDATAGTSQGRNIPEASFDEDEATRWANSGTLSTAWIRYNFENSDIYGASIQFYKGDTRTYPIRISVGNVIVFEGTTRTTAGYWKASFEGIEGGSLQVEMTGTNSDGHEWLSIYEIDIFGKGGGNEQIPYALHCSPIAAPFDGQDSLCDGGVFDRAIYPDGVYVYVWQEDGIGSVQDFTTQCNGFHHKRNEKYAPWEALGGNPIEALEACTVTASVSASDGRMIDLIADFRID